MTDALAWGVFSFVVTVVAMVPTIAVLRRSGVLDVPNARSSHGAPTLRGGGVACVIGVLTATITVWDERWALAVVVASVAFAALGLVDDLRHLAAPTRLLVQLVLAIGVAIALAPLLPDGAFSRAAAIAGAVVLLVGFTNIFNFMDGINGISGLHALVIGGLVAVAADRANGEATAEASVVGLAVAGAGVAFLVFNFRARPVVFLGDAGSYLFGSALAGLIVLAWCSGTTIEAAGGSAAIYIADSATTLVRRARRRVRLFDAHREHAYQRLVQLGWSHRGVSLVVAAASAIVGLIGLLTHGASAATRTVLDIAGLLLCAAYVASPELAPRRSRSLSAT